MNPTTEDHAAHGDMLAYRDGLVSRCTCGAWVWRGRCRTCDPIAAPVAHAS